MNASVRMAGWAVAATAVICAGPAPAARGQCRSEEAAHLLLAHGAANDNLGFSVAISGDTALLGAYGRNFDTGAAYVFLRSGNHWAQTATLKPADGTFSEFFAYSVAISGDVAVIGAYGDNDQGPYSGSAYVFERIGGVWTQTAKLLASGGATADYFGSSVAISDGTIVVGAYRANVLAGFAYVFEKLQGLWTETARLMASDTARLDRFGFSVAVSGGTIVVGATEHQIDVGSAYVFQKLGGVWTQTTELRTTSLQGYFGYSVAISRDTIVVAEPQGGDQPLLPGTAHVFERTSGDWAHTATLSPSYSIRNELFGTSVAVSEDRILVGTYQDASNHQNPDSVYVFQKLGGSWKQTEALLAADGAPDDHFGFSVAISGGAALVGAWGNDDRGDSSGSAYVFRPISIPCDTNCDGSLN